MQIFIPWDSSPAFIFPLHVSTAYIPHFYGIVFTLFAMFYSILGGMHSSVLGAVIKYAIMTVACISIGVDCDVPGLHAAHPTPGLNSPEGWLNPFFGWKLGFELAPYPGTKRARKYRRTAILPSAFFL